MGSSGLINPLQPVGVLVYTIETDFSQSAVAGWQTLCDRLVFLPFLSSCARCVRHNMTTFHSSVAKHYGNYRLVLELVSLIARDHDPDLETCRSESEHFVKIGYNIWFLII